MKRLDTGAFVKEYESENREYEQALQMTVSDVISEDPRFLEKEPPPISEEFEIGSKVFFLGDHAYGVAAQVSETAQNSLAVMLAVSSDFTAMFGLPLTRCDSSSRMRRQKLTASNLSSHHA